MPGRNAAWIQHERLVNASKGFFDAGSLKERRAQVQIGIFRRRIDCTRPLEKPYRLVKRAILGRLNALRGECLNAVGHLARPFHCRWREAGSGVGRESMAMLVAFAAAAVAWRVAADILRVQVKYSLVCSSGRARC